MDAIHLPTRDALAALCRRWQIAARHWRVIVEDLPKLIGDLEKLGA